MLLDELDTGADEVQPVVTTIDGQDRRSWESGGVGTEHTRGIGNDQTEGLLGGHCVLHLWQANLHALVHVVDHGVVLSDLYGYGVEVGPHHIPLSVLYRRQPDVAGTGAEF